MREYMEAQSGHDDGKVPKHIVTEILALRSLAAGRRALPYRPEPR
jgi:hypothetical protein